MSALPEILASLVLPLVSIPGVSGPPAPVEYVCIEVKVFFDFNADGMWELPVDTLPEVGVEGFLVCLLRDGEPVGDPQATDENGCTVFKVPLDCEETPQILSSQQPKYEVMIKGPTGMQGVYGFLNLDNEAGAQWELTTPSVEHPEDTVCVDIYADNPRVVFGVLSYGDPDFEANQPVQSAEFWCEQKNKKMVLEILEGCDPAWRMTLNMFCLRWSCLTNQFGAKDGMLVIKEDNALPAALNLLCRFFEKENCGTHPLRDLSKPMALVLLSALCLISDTTPRIYLDVDGTLVELSVQAEATRNLLCNPNAVNLYQFPDLLASVLGCINEWAGASEGGVYRRSNSPLNPDYGDGGDEEDLTDS